MEDKKGSHHVVRYACVDAKSLCMSHGLLGLGSSYSNAALEHQRVSVKGLGSCSNRVRWVSQGNSQRSQHILSTNAAHVQTTKCTQATHNVHATHASHTAYAEALTAHAQ
jgi:hypothetical protein